LGRPGYGQEAYRQKSRDADLDGHLVKPIGLDSLKDYVGYNRHRGN
jgi:hypothetical protein